MRSMRLRVTCLGVRYFRIILSQGQLRGFLIESTNARIKLCADDGGLRLDHLVRELLQLWTSCGLQGWKGGWDGWRDGWIENVDGKVWYHGIGTSREQVGERYSSQYIRYMTQCYSPTTLLPPPASYLHSQNHMARASPFVALN